MPTALAMLQQLNTSRRYAIPFVLGGDWGKDSPVEEFNQAVYCIRGADIPNLQNAELGKMPVRYLKSSSLKKRSLKSEDIVIEISGGSPTQSTGRPVLITEELLKQLSLLLAIVRTLFRKEAETLDFSLVTFP
jgi:type I restriction enzyme S subunit